MNYMILDDLGTLSRAIIDFITDNLTPSGNFGVYEHFSKASDNIMNLLTSGALGTIVDAFVPIGYMMAMIFLSKEFLEKTTLKNIDLEQIFKMFLKLVVACALVTNVKSLIIGFNTFSNTITNEFITALSAVGANSADSVWSLILTAIIGAGPDSLADIATVTGRAGTMLDIGIAILYSVAALIGSLIYMIALSFASYSRAIAIGYRSIYAPIAVSNIVGYSTRNAAISYLKSLFALFMHMPIALIGVTVAVNTSATLLSTGHPMLSIIAYFMGIGWISGSQRISNELFK